MNKTLLKTIQYKEYKIIICKDSRYFIIALLNRNNVCKYYFVTRKIYKSENELYPEEFVNNLLKKSNINNYETLFEHQINELKHFVNTGQYCYNKFCVDKDNIPKRLNKDNCNCIMISEFLDKPGFLNNYIF